MNKWWLINQHALKSRSSVACSWCIYIPCICRWNSFQNHDARDVNDMLAIPNSPEKCFKPMIEKNLIISCGDGKMVGDIFGYVPVLYAVHNQAFRTLLLCRWSLLIHSYIRHITRSSGKAHNRFGAGIFARGNQTLNFGRLLLSPQNTF